MSFESVAFAAISFGIILVLYVLAILLIPVAVILGAL